jgi:uncharacterized membrane protein YgdD (TMEM256/DUF423 family)
MHKNYLAWSAIFGLLAVSLGAFGAHGLEKITSDPVILHGFQTGVQYQFYHAFALMGVGILFTNFAGRWLNAAAVCFIIGTILFCGSLYALIFLKIQGSAIIRFVGPVTPLGGLFFIAGWLCLLIAVMRRKGL